MAKKKVVKKKKAASYADSTYNKQISYYDKLLADFRAQQTRQTNDISTYYGRQATKDVTDHGTYTSKYEKKGGKWVKRKKPVQKKLGTYQMNHYKSNYWKDTKGKWHKRSHPVDKTSGFKRDKKGHKIENKKRIVKKGSAATEGLYQQELNQNRTRDLTDIADDYAGRGMIHSGLYAQKRGDYEKEFGKQKGETNRQKTKQYGDLSAESTQFAREQELQREQAKLEAIRRRAAMSGNLGL